MKTPNSLLNWKDRARPDAGLYLAALPIGNLEDISLRVLGLLSSADEIWAEDTRNIRKLLQIYGISTEGKRLVSCHEHNESALSKSMVEKLGEGLVIAYVSDAGMPVISDPGFRLVEAAITNKLYYTVLPGASAIPTALILSGAPADRFAFYGFAPNKSAARKRFFDEIRAAKTTALVFESPKRIGACLRDAASCFGEAHMACVTRELTKKFEEARRGTLGDLAEFYQNEAAKGEIVLVIWPAEVLAEDESEIRERLAKYLKTMPTKAAAKQLSAESSWSKNDLYALALDLQNNVSKTE